MQSASIGIAMRSLLKVLSLFLIIIALFGQVRYYLGLGIANVGYVRLNRIIASDPATLINPTGKFIQAAGYFAAAEGISGSDSAGLQRGRMKTRVTVDSFLDIGEVFDTLHEPVVALHWYTLASEIDPGHSDPWYQMAVSTNWRLTADSRNPRLSLDLLNKALVADNFSSAEAQADAYFYTGALVCNYLGSKASECIPYYEMAVKLNSSHAFALMELGRNYYRFDSNLDRAIAVIKRALETEDSFELKWAYFHLGEAYREAGEREQAAAQYNMALAIDPQWVQALRSKQEIDP